MPIAQPKPIFDDVPAWPERPTPANATIGHNKPPIEETIPEEFRAALIEDRPDFLTKLDALIGAAERAKAEDDETLGRCGDLVNAYRKAQNHIDAVHKEVKEPHLKAGRLVDAEKNALTAKLIEARAKVEAVGNAFVAKRDAERRAEQERIAAEQRAAAERARQAEIERQRVEREAEEAARNAASEEERQAAAARAEEAQRKAEEAMAAAALAPASTAKQEPIRSDAGATVSSATEYAFKVDDYAKAFKHVRNDAKVREAIDAAIKRLVKQTKGQVELTGVTIWPVAKANFR